MYNLIIICTSVIMISILIGLLYVLFNKLIIPSVEIISNKLSRLIIKQAKRESVFIGLELIFLFIAIGVFFLFFIEFTTYVKNLIFFVFAIVLILLSIVISNLKSKMKFKGIIDTIHSSLPKNNYIIRKISLVFLQLPSLFNLVVFFLFIFQLVPLLRLNLSGYYTIFTILPIGLIIWVYMAFRDKESMEMRKIVVYILLVFLAIKGTFNKFLVVTDSPPTNSFEDYFVYIIITIYLAIERLLKVILDDYERHKNKDNSY
ncbi:hypothetical protein ABFG93_22960 (plasmid) [Pseudalkalibacillus hwajinpoensis]|uniref:hypothetical protein n=1 Tax=Guptibacillus hwajinpoensis TaxID=208199 RepID=UPI00325AA60B